MTEITSNLYLGSYDDVNETTIKKYGITCVMNMTIEVEDVSFPGVENVCYQLYDTKEANIKQYFHACADKIDEVHKTKGRILVHCVRGISRSATICLAYFLKHTEMTLREASYFLTGKNPKVRPNPGFFRQLIRFEEELRGCATVKIILFPMGSVPDVYREVNSLKNMVGDHQYLCEKDGRQLNQDYTISILIGRIVLTV